MFFAAFFYWILRIPRIITVYKDGSIEFVGILRKTKTHASEIIYRKPEGISLGFLVVKAKKKINILAQFDGFHDFIIKLKTLNPSIEFRGC